MELLRLEFTNKKIIYNMPVKAYCLIFIELRRYLRTLLELFLK